MSQDLPPLSPRLQALEAIDARTRRNRRLAVAGLLLVLLAAIVAGFFVYRTWLYQVKIGADLRRDLAFRHETPTIMSGSEREEVFALYPEVGGVMDRAGVEEGDIVDLGDRRFEILHIPGHSPGSIGLWEEATGILFSGDCIYDGPLLDGLSDSDITAYITSMKRLRDLPVRVVHAGHDASFGRDRLVELVDAYLDLRDI